MAKFKISRWLDGINTRINKFRIKDSESVNAVDVDISNLEVKPQKGLDTNNTASGDYNFKGTWEADSSAIKFTESGDYLIKSYASQNPKYNRRKYDNSGNDVGVATVNGTENLGVPIKPASAPTTAIDTVGQSGSAIAYSTIHTKSLNENTDGVSSIITADNGGLATITHNNLSGSNDTEDTGYTYLGVFGGSNYTALYNASSKTIRRRKTVTNAGDFAFNDVQISGLNEWFVSGDYFVGIDTYYENVYILNLASASSASSVSLDQPSAFLTTNNGFSQLANASQFKDGWEPTGVAEAGTSNALVPDKLNGVNTSNGAASTDRHITISYSANDAYVFIKRNYGSKYMHSMHKNHYGTAQQNYRYSVDNGYSYSGTGTSAFSRFSTARFNNRSSGSGSTAPRWEFHCTGTNPTTLTPDGTDTTQWWDTPTNYYGTNGAGNWRNALVWIVPGFPTLGASASDAQWNSSDTSVTNIRNFITRLKFKFSAIAGGSRTSSSGSFVVNPFDADTLYEFGDTVAHPGSFSYMTSKVVPLLEAKRIQFDGETYTAMLLFGCVGLTQHSQSTSLEPHFHYDHTNHTFRTYKQNPLEFLSESGGIHSQFGVNGTANTYINWIWSSYEGHYATYNTTDANWTLDRSKKYQIQEDTVWSWDDDGAKQVWCYPVSNHVYPDSFSSTMGNFYPVVQNNAEESRPTGANQKWGHYQSLSQPKLTITQDQNGADASVKVEMKQASSLGGYTSNGQAYEPTNLSYENRFVVNLSSMNVGTHDARSLYPIAWPHKPFMNASSFQWSTNYQYYNLFTVHDRIALANASKATPEITGLKNIGLTDGPTTVYGNMKNNPRYGLPMILRKNNRTGYLTDNYLSTSVTPVWSGSANANDFTNVSLASTTNRASLCAQTDIDGSTTAYSISETSATNGLDYFHDKLFSIRTSGAAQNDVIFYDITGNNYQIHKNKPSSGDSFGTSQASASLNAFDLISKDSDNLLFINSAGSGETIRVLDTSANYAVSDGSTAYNFLANNAKDAIPLSGFVLFRSGDNELRVYSVNNNTKYASWFRLPFRHAVAYSGEFFYGHTYDGNGYVNQYKKGFVFFDYDITGMTTAGNVSLYDSSNGSKGNKGREIKHIFLEPVHDLYVLFNEPDHAFTYDKQAFYLIISNNREVRVSAEAEVVTINNVTTTNGAGTFNPNSLSDRQLLQEKDNLVISGNGLTTVNSTLNTKTSTLHTIASGSFSSAISTAQVVATRYVRKNVAWLNTTDYNNIQTKVLALATTYGGVDQAVQFTNTASKAWLAIGKSSLTNNAGTIVSFDLSSVYFYARFEKNLYNTNNQSVGAQTFSTGGSTLYQTGSANIPFQYKYSYLKDIKASGEPEMLIEGPLSDEASPLTLTGPTQTVSITFSGSTPIGVTKARLYRVGGDYASYYRLSDIAISNNSVPTYDDSEGAITTGFFGDNNDTGVLPDGLTNISYANGIYAGSIKSKIYFSEYGNPHSWPEAGVIDLYGIITNITENNGEFIVFTETAMYRVRGYNFNSMSAVKIPFNQGLPSDNKNSLVEYKNSLYFISNDGLCVYSNGSVSVISLSKFSSFPEVVSPRSAWKDDVLYIFNSNSNSSINGVKMDMRTGSPSFSRITQKAVSRAFYDQKTDKLYLKGSGTEGVFLEGSDSSINITSGELTMGDAEVDKAFFRYSILYSGSGTIAFSADGSEFHSKSLSNASTPTLLKDQFTDFVVSTSINYTITGVITVFGLEIDAEPIETFKYPQRFVYADVTYTGQPTVSMFMDNGDALTMNPAGSALPSSATPKTVRLYYPTNTTGNTPHYTATGTGFIEDVIYERVAL